MSPPRLIAGLTLTSAAVVALIGWTLLGLAQYLTAERLYGLPGGWPVMIVVWSVFTLGALLCALGAPSAARPMAVLMLLLSAGSLLTFGDEIWCVVGAVGAGFGVVALCPFQDSLARVLGDQEASRTIKRAYRRPLMIFLAAIVVAMIATCFATLGLVAQALLSAVLLACPMWGMAQLSLVGVQLISGLKKREEGALAAPSSSVSSSEF